jgi:hypothetical protein
MHIHYTYKSGVGKMFVAKICRFIKITLKAVPSILLTLRQFIEYSWMLHSLLKGILSNEKLELWIGNKWLTMFFKTRALFSVISHRREGRSPEIRDDCETSSSFKKKKTSLIILSLFCKVSRMDGTAFKVILMNLHIFATNILPTPLL